MLPTNQVVARYFNNPKHYNTLGKIVREGVDRLSENAISLGISHDKLSEEVDRRFAHIAGSSSSPDLRSVVSTHISDCISTLNPPFEVVPPPVKTSDEAESLYRRKALGRFATAALGIGGLGASTLFGLGSPMMSWLVGGAAWLIGSAYLMKAGIRYAHQLAYGEPAAYNENRNFILFNPECDPRKLELIAWHETTHAVQHANPSWTLGPEHKAFKEGQAIDIEHQYGMSSSDPEVRLYTLYDRICLLLPYYLDLAKFHTEDRGDLENDPWAQVLSQLDINWHINPLHCIGASVFSVARELKELPTSRDILSGSFDFISS